MHYIIDFFENLFILASAMSFYILIGLIIAGFLKQFIADDFIAKHLGKSSVKSVVKSTIFGIPLPVCSCSVIPLAKSLQQEGASRGSVLSFLISAPITGVDSILATYSFFGWIFTIYRVVTSVIMAIVVGIIENLFKVKKSRFVVASKDGSCCGTQNKTFTALKPNSVVKKEANSCCSQESNINSSNNNSCCSSGSCCDTPKSEPFFKRVINYAFNTLFSDIAKSLLIGLLLGALFTTLMPKDIMTYLGENRFIAYILILLIAMPMYVCATSSLPIAAAFVLNGLSAGAAFIFLSAGPATSTTTMSVVTSMFGKRTLFVYIGVIAILSIIFGFLLDTFMPNIDLLISASSVNQIGLLDKISTIIMFILIGYYLIKK